jgi:hypothetical protein
MCGPWYGYWSSWSRYEGQVSCRRKGESSVKIRPVLLHIIQFHTNPRGSFNGKLALKV